MGTNRAEGAMQVFKLLVRSCHHWQLKVCNQFYELFAARHAPWVLLPASNPGRPQSLRIVLHLNTKHSVGSVLPGPSGCGVPGSPGIPKYL